MSAREFNPQHGVYDRADVERCIRQAKIERALYLRACLTRLARVIAHMFRTRRDAPRRSAGRRFNPSPRRSAPLAS